jgi:bacteriocin leader peptide (microcyclamide/patellamide family)
MPQAAQPVNRSTTGQLPDVLAELSEEALQLHGDNAETAAVFASRFVYTSFDVLMTETTQNRFPLYLCQKISSKLPFLPSRSLIRQP